MPNIMTSLLEKRAKLIAEARQMIEEAAGRGEVLEGEAKTKYDAMFKDAQAIRNQVDDMLKLEAEEGSLKVAWDLDKDQRTDPARGTAKSMEDRALEAFVAAKGDRTLVAKDMLPHLDALQMEAYGAFLKDGESALASNGRYRAALQITDVTKGGYFKAPQAFVQGVLKVADQFVAIRRLATVMNDTTGEGFGVVSLDTDLADFEWSTEIPASITEDDNLAFGGRELKPNPMRKRILASKDLANRYPSVISLVQNRLGYKGGLTMERGYMLGSGSKQPLGVFTVSPQGLTTARDVATDMGATNFTMDGLKAVRAALRQPYRMSPKCSWLFHPDGVYKISLLKDGAQQYYWQPSVVAGEPDVLLSIPVAESELCPNTFTASQYVGMLADWQYYWIADYEGMSIQRLVELYAATNQDGWIANLASDGLPVLSEAFVRIKLGT